MKKSKSVTGGGLVTGGGSVTGGGLVTRSKRLVRCRILGYKGEWAVYATRKTGKLDLWDYDKRISEIFSNRQEAREWYRALILYRSAPFETTVFGAGSRAEQIKKMLMH